MKLSEAILLGSTMVAAKPGGQYFSETKSGCALGMAAVARGCSFGPATHAVAENERRALGAEGVWGQWVLRVVMRPCECWMFRVPRQMRIKDIITHLFDFHVMKKKNWTLERLAAWVQTWEPKEIAAPIARAASSVKPSMNGPRIDRQQEEQEWRRVRQVFEVRHKARQPRPAISGADQEKRLLS
jgi:hypothetical protein